MEPGRLGVVPCNVIVCIPEVSKTVGSKTIVSIALLLPAAHSPATEPDTALRTDAAIASLSVHLPSVALGDARSSVVLTVMVAPAASIIGTGIIARAAAACSDAGTLCLSLVLLLLASPVVVDTAPATSRIKLQINNIKL